MNRTNIQWAEYSFNPIVGCTNNCPYCYGKAVAQRLSCPQCQAYEPHFHPERLADLSRGKPGRVFMGSMGDMFDPKVDPAWWNEILLAHAESQFRHKLMVLTKRPDLIREKIIWKDRNPISGTLWIGVTVTCQDDDWRIKDLLQVPAAGHFVSYEPMLGPAGDRLWLPHKENCQCAICVYNRNTNRPSQVIDWLIIGGLSGPWLPKGYWGGPWLSKSSFHNAEATWANQIIDQAQAAGVPVFVKTKPVKLPGVEVIQEWPGGLKGD